MCGGGGGGGGGGGLEWIRKGDEAFRVFTMHLGSATEPSFAPSLSGRGLGIVQPTVDSESSLPLEGRGEKHQPTAHSAMERNTQ